MLKSGGVVIPMLLCTDKITCLFPRKPNWELIRQTPSLDPFNDRICAMLSEVSQILLRDPVSKAYPDVVTFAFWCRKASLETMKNRHNVDSRLGRGVLFHITPSNVPVNFAYSLAAGLLAGNVNIVRVPTKEFPQVAVITNAFAKVLGISEYDSISPYVVLVRYERNDEINAYLSTLCDIRIIWGGDVAIDEIRRAPLPSRSFDITFADRYSICLINALAYLESNDADKIARDFYNDTYLFDQNACTAPHLVVWLGDCDSIAMAQERFWTELHHVVARQYSLQPVQAVDKLSAFYKSAVNLDIKRNTMPDNLIVRVNLEQLIPGIENYRCPCGYFAEYIAGSLDEIGLVVNRKFQTLSYYGMDVLELQKSLIKNGFHGIDRIVPVGKTMNFSLNWDGYDLMSTLSRKIEIIG